MRTNTSLDRAIAGATNPADLRQLLHNVYENAGIITHVPGGDAVVTEQAPAAVSAALPSRDNFSATAQRVIYPHGNIKLVISGVDEEALDAIEERIRRSFEQ